MLPVLFSFIVCAGIHSFVSLRRKLSFYSAVGQVDCTKLEELVHEHGKVRHVRVSV